MDGYEYQMGVANFFRAWLVKENARMAKEDWLKAVVKAKARRPREFYKVDE